MIARQMNYVGDNPALQGRTALVREYEARPGMVLAQFDFPYDEGSEADVMFPQCPLTTGWYAFEGTDFAEACGCNYYGPCEEHAAQYRVMK